MKLPKAGEMIHVMRDNADVFDVMKEITESGQQEDAFFVFDMGDVVRKHREWKLHLPRVEPYYAVKCNDKPILLETLTALGLNFDCASKSEINKVLSLGVDPSRLIFANPTKMKSHIQYAMNENVSLMTFDNESEMEKVKKLGYAKEARMILRIRCDAKVSQCPLGEKFGCNPETDAPYLLQLAKTMGMNVVGISFHVGSGCGDAPVFRRAIRAASELFVLAGKLGFDFNILDIGGGFPGLKGTTIAKFADIINRALDDYFPNAVQNGIRIIAEPGRFYASSAFTLACSIHSRRQLVAKNGDNAHMMYYINDGVYSSFNCLLFDHATVQPKTFKNTSDVRLSSVWGPTCDSLDKIVDSQPLPEMQVGDWMYFEDMGAYTLCAASEFNGFPVSKVHVVVNDHMWKVLQNVFPLNEREFSDGFVPLEYPVGKSDLVDVVESEALDVVCDAPTISKDSCELWAGVEPPVFFIQY